MSNAEQLAAIEARLQELQKVVKESLNLRAVGGAHVINELFAILPQIAAVKAAVEVLETPAEPIA